jgi:aminoglycoside phosphotransferase (APT) family kinase protein
MDKATRENIERCRSLEDFGFDLDAAEHLWDEAMRLPGAADRVSPRWYHGDLAAENLFTTEREVGRGAGFRGLIGRGPDGRPGGGLGNT